MRKELISISETEILQLRIEDATLLKQMRETKGWSKGYVARCLDSRTDYISAIESGKQNPSLDFYNKYFLLLQKNIT